MTPDVLLKTDEVLKYLRINRRTLYRLLKDGRIPATRVGREWRFRKRDLDAWLEGRTTGAGPRTFEPERTPVSKLPSTRKTILIVQPDEHVRKRLRRGLSVFEHTVADEVDGLAALARLGGQPCDLLITGLRLPGLDGLALIRAVRQVRQTLPIVVLTAHSTEEDAIEALNLGVVGYLTHPYAMRDLLELVARALREE